MVIASSLLMGKKDGAKRPVSRPTSPHLFDQVNVESTRQG